jgi:hypothetical protein
VTDSTTLTRRDTHEAALTWLEQEFPGWTMSLGTTTTSDGDPRPLFVAHRDGHHPQSELSPAKLHTRLSDYHDREARKRALSN